LKISVLKICGSKKPSTLTRLELLIAQATKLVKKIFIPTKNEKAVCSVA